jgi:hypothetical protein
MKTLPSRFNFYLLGLLPLAMLCGCVPMKTKPKGPVAALRLHLEVNPDGTDRSLPVPVYREKPVMINVEKSPFLDERSVARAKVVDTLGGFALQIEFDRQGSWLLEQCSTSGRGRRCAIFCQFGEAKLPTSRWLAAPIFSRSITDGILVFTPDATREEAERIVTGLNNVAKQYQQGRK